MEEKSHKCTYVMRGTTTGASDSAESFSAPDCMSGGSLNSLYERKFFDDRLEIVS